MTKTNFSSGVIVTSAFLNGAQQIYFDGQNLDWHYPPLGLNSLVTTGVNGLDGRYITLQTDQPNLSPATVIDPISGNPVTSYQFVGGSSISGEKVVTGIWNFGYDPLVVGNPPNVASTAPRSYTTNTKYAAGGATAPARIGSMSSADLTTIDILVDQLTYLLENLEIDNGIYFSSVGTCTNYSKTLDPTASDIICPT
jgi:hypothetical protein